MSGWLLGVSHPPQALKQWKGTQKAGAGHRKGTQTLARLKLPLAFI